MISVPLLAGFASSSLPSLASWLSDTLPVPALLSLSLPSLPLPLSMSFSGAPAFSGTPYCVSFTPQWAMNVLSRISDMADSGSLFLNETRRLGSKGLSLRYSLCPMKYCMYGFSAIWSTSSRSVTPSLLWIYRTPKATSPG